MKNSKLLAVLLAAVAGTQCLTGCSGKKGSNVQLYADTAATSDTESAAGGSEFSGDNYQKEEYADQLLEYVNSIEVDDSELDLGSVDDDLITPEEGAVDYDLGSYRLSSGGIKLYYNADDFPRELMLTFEKYFESFASADYNNYLKCLFPEYIPEMEAALAKNEDHDMKASFVNQCSNLADKMHGDFKITRIKVEKNAEQEDGTDSLEEYFKPLSNYFGKDYYSEVKEQCDDIIDACFYVMAENAYGQETMMVQGFKIAFAVKDGKYYTFG